MLRTRVITALILLAVLLGVVWTGSVLLFKLVLVIFFGAAQWESARLFKGRMPVLSAVIWSAILLFLLVRHPLDAAYPFSMLCVAIWAIRLAPALGLGLPPLGSFANTLVSVVYGTAVLGCFVAISALYLHSPLYLLSVMAMSGSPTSAPISPARPSASASWPPRSLPASHGKARSAAPSPSSC